MKPMPPGLYGKPRRGLAEENDVATQIEIQMGTLGKALGSAGGYICGSRALIDYLVNRARPFIFYDRARAGSRGGGGGGSAIWCKARQAR